MSRGNLEMGADTELHPGEILELEFEYAHETATQAQNDRTVVVNLYLILVGAVGSLALALPTLSQSDKFNLPAPVLGLLFILIAVLGFLTLFKLIRLRQAWHESAMAMNTIKRYYIQHLPELKTAFYWRASTIPRHDKPWTITFILALMVVLIDSVALGGGILMLLSTYPTLGLPVTVASTILAFFLQIAFYFYQLGKSETKVESQKQEEADQTNLPLRRKYENE